jgi:nitronate monooxygenase
MLEHPRIIQGGMGAGVSNWRLARAVSETGQLGVVSGTALDQILARRLQDGDPGGHMRRGLNSFPFPAMAERIWQAYYIAGGRRDREPYRKLAMHNREDPRELRELCIAGNFVEVFLAREGHGNPVGINYLEKVQIPHLPSLYGAMLAGVDYVLMGAGIPLKIPGALDSLARHEPSIYHLPVTGALPGDDNFMKFVPREYMEVDLPLLARPKFLAIIASNVLAATMLKKANGRVDGFVIEGPIAGGHNAPPRGKGPLSETGEPVYGERDHVDLEAIRELGAPFWLAGGYGSPEKLREALDAGAAGIQVGTAFAYCAESGLREDFKAAILRKLCNGGARVFTDPLASPTGFPFKVVRLEGSLSEEDEYADRPRICDLGYLREAFRTPDGGIDYRCAAEPVPLYVAKGGREENTTGRKCLCNSLLSDIGLAQFRNGRRVEGGLVTSGDDLPQVVRFMPESGTRYRARDVVARLLATVEEEAEEFGTRGMFSGVPVLSGG